MTPSIPSLRSVRFSRPLPWFAAFCALTASFPTTLLAEEATRPPNVVFILVDDLGWSDGGVLGSEYYETPQIDRLARDGMRFTNAYSANPLCSPTRASLLTGQSPARHGLMVPAGHLDEVVLKGTIGEKAVANRRAATPGLITRFDNTFVTYAEVLREAGYRTAFMGKWHLGSDPYLPEKQGFDVVVGGRKDHGPPPPGYFGPWPETETLPDVPEGTHVDDVLGNEAVRFIRDNKDRPFLLNLWFYDVHSPYQAKPDLIKKYAAKTDPTGRHQSPTMGSMIETMDTNLGRVLDALDEAGLRDNTIIIFTSDNGGNMYDRIGDTTPTNNAPLRAGKGNNYEGGVRVPLIVDWPGVTRRGSLSDALVSSEDIFPTILEMTGLPLRPELHVDGTSFVSALKGESFQRGPLISHFPFYMPRPKNHPNTSIRDGDWKFYRFYFRGEHGENEYELYNLRDDPGETRNLVAENPELAGRLDAAIETFLIETKTTRPIRNHHFDPNFKPTPPAPVVTPAP